MNITVLGTIVLFAGIAYSSLLLPNWNNTVSRWLITLGLFTVADKTNIPENLLGSSTQKFMYSLGFCALGAWLLISSIV